MGAVLSGAVSSDKFHSDFNPSDLDKKQGACVSIRQPTAYSYLAACLPHHKEKKRERLTPNYRPDHAIEAATLTFLVLALADRLIAFPSITDIYIRRRTCGSCAFQVAFTLLIMIGFFRIINSINARRRRAPSARCGAWLDGVSAYIKGLLIHRRVRERCGKSPIWWEGYTRRSLSFGIWANHNPICIMRISAVLRRVVENQLVRKSIWEIKAANHISLYIVRLFRQYLQRGNMFMAGNSIAGVIKI